MSELESDYLWDPRGDVDADLATLEKSLRPLGADALGLADRPLRLPVVRDWTLLRYAAAFVGAVLLCVGALQYRLSWKEGAPWTMVIHDQSGARTAELQVDQRHTTQVGESLTIDVARIGEVEVAPESTIRLIATRKGGHRVELERGRLHARVWAPQNYFAVRSGDSRFVDLGCEFDLEMDGAGNGSLHVTSGFVIHRADAGELLVPQGYRVSLTDHRAATPIRPDASDKFRSAVAVLDRMLNADILVAERVLSAKSRGLIDEIVASAVDADYFTLLELLVRHPELAVTELYPRLAQALDVTPDEEHRLRWIQGDAAAREEWWDKMPRQPKTWWLNWRDAF